MGGIKYFSTECIISSLLLLLLRTQAQDNKKQWCTPKTNLDNPGTPMPTLPEFYSTQMQINFESEEYTAEVIEIADYRVKKRSIELWSGDRHVKYISLVEPNVFLTIHYEPKGPTCNTSELSFTHNRGAYDTKDAGPLGILKILEEQILPKKSNFRSLGPTVVKGIYVMQWEICEYTEDFLTAVRVLVSFSDPSWKPAHPVYTSFNESKEKSEIVQVEVEVKGGNLKKEIRLTADYYRYQPYTTEERDFQPPGNVHCPGYNTDVKPPVLPDYFSYQSEIIVYQSSTGEAPIVSYRKVYYDYKNGITRIDSQDALSDNSDPFSPVSAQVRSMIHDFNSGVQYTLDPLYGTCSVNVFEMTFDVVTATKTVSAVMLDPKQFFSLKDVALSYNGQYDTRGMITDVFSGKVTTKKESRIFFWHFTTDRIQLVEDQQVEKNILVKLISRPESGIGAEGEVEINFYNFIEEEPSAVNYDITACYNESSSQTFVLAFPGDYNPFLKEYTTMVQYMMHQAIKDTTEISQQRVYVQQITFKSPYLFTQFKLLDLPPVEGKVPKPVRPEANLQESVDKLKKAISDGTFQVTIRTKDNLDVVLKPEPNGLNEFRGDRNTETINLGYKEGSVIGLSMGLLLLGILLGGVVVNLVVSKKFGVSLLQNSKFFGGGPKSFANPLNESEM